MQGLLLVDFVVDVPLGIVGDDVAARGRHLAQVFEQPGHLMLGSRESMLAIHEDVPLVALALQNGLVLPDGLFLVGESGAGLSRLLFLGARGHGLGVHLGEDHA